MTIESQATPEVQAEAAKIGWQGPDRFKGEPETFVDADEYIKRAETVLPIVKENNKRLSADLADMRARLEAAVAKNSDLEKRMSDIDIEHSARLAKEVKRAKEDALSDLEAAIEAGDNPKLIARLTKQVAALENVEEPVVKKAEESKPNPADDPAVRAWNAWAAENKFDEWAPRDRREFVLIGQELRAKGNRNIGQAFVDDIMRELKPVKKEEFQEEESKVAGGKGSGAPRGGKKSGYESLSAEEKAACDADSRQFVGPGKKFKDAGEYRTHWAKVYQEMQ